MKEATTARPEDQEPEFTLGDWANSDNIPYDKTAEYETHIQPLVTKLLAEAKKRDISLAVLAVGVVDENGGVGTYRAQNLALAVEHIPAEALIIPFVQDVSPSGGMRYAALVGADGDRVLRLRNKVTH